MNAKKTSNRITIDALKYYVPLFQAGDEAATKLLSEGEKLSPHERNHLETVMKLRDLSTRKIAKLSGPLIIKELQKLISNSHLRNREDVYDILYFAGIDGLKRGLRKFEVDKINVSSTNYLFQWLVTYAKKELINLEAPFGIPPSRFGNYKKVSAVRKKLSEQLDRYATNEEVFEFFQSGQADIKTMNGRVKDSGKVSKANQNITIDLIEEQENFEKNMLTVDLLDPLDDYSGEIKMSERNRNIFSETAFGVFTETYNITPKAKVVIMSTLNASDFSEEEIKLLESINQKEYKSINNQWKNLLKDIKGPFYQFLNDNKDSNFEQFDVIETIKNIERYNKKVNISLYSSLFENGKASLR